MRILNRETLKDFPEWYKNMLEEGGIILVNKELDWTSFDVIAKMRGILRIKKIGHGGTLDPLATGLLLVCVGRPATKLSGFYQDYPKEYRCKITIGASTKTYDLESEPENFKDYSNISRENIIEVINSFIGEISQVPPRHSAVKINGKRAYELARKDSEFELEHRKITIYSISDINITLPEIEFSVLCSKGTYIRSLANDIGERLGCGAYLSGLIRTKIADFSVENSLMVDEIRNAEKMRKEDENI